MKNICKNERKFRKTDKSIRSEPILPIQQCLKSLLVKVNHKSQSQLHLSLPYFPLLLYFSLHNYFTSSGWKHHSMPHFVELSAPSVTSSSLQFEANLSYPIYFYYYFCIYFKYLFTSLSEMHLKLLALKLDYLGLAVCQFYHIFRFLRMYFITIP